MQIKFKDLGLIEYGRALNYQETLFKKNLTLKTDNQPIDPKLLFCEHPHVYTLGKSGERNNLLISQPFLNEINATYYETNRGGDITYHGPGQIVGYPILDLHAMDIGAKEYIFKMEESVIELLKDYSISGTRIKEATGVWLGIGTPNARKICAIGVKVSRGITMHGFAFNINTDLSYYNHIVPCGITDKKVTSMEQELGGKQDFETIKKQLLVKIAEQYNIEIIA